MFEVVFYLSVVALVVCASVSALRIQMSTRATFVVSALLFAGVAQGLGPVDRYYPFVRWDMYANAGSTTRYVDYVYSNQSGEEKDYPFQLIVFSSPRAFAARFDVLQAICECESRYPPLDNAIMALAKVLRRHTGEVMQSFALIERDSARAAYAVTLYEWHRGQ